MRYNTKERLKSFMGLVGVIGGIFLLWITLTVSGCSTGPEPIQSVELRPDGRVYVDAHGEAADTTVKLTRLTDYLGQAGYTAEEANWARRQARQLEEAYQMGRAQRLKDEREKVTWLARTLYGEANTARGMLYVGSVVLNRVRSPKHPNTIRRAVTKEWAFESVTRNARSLDTLDLGDYADGPTAWRMAIRMSYLTLRLPERYRPLKQATHFYSPVSMPNWKPEPKWAKGRRPLYSMGENGRRFRFYRVGS